MDILYSYSLIAIFSCALIVFVILFFVSAPYGKFMRKGWGPGIRSKWAWLTMEFMSPALILVFFLFARDKNIVEIIFVSAWLIHYVHRTFIYPFSQSGRDKHFPVAVALMAVVFNILNGFVNGYGIFHLNEYGLSWLGSWQFITGTVLFTAGFIINKTADEKLRILRKNNGQDYVIPKGWLFDYVSCPHYLGELIEWAGWAIMTWSVPGLAFFVFTFANLFPRAVRTHRWYRQYFDDYPSRRKAIIPFII
ncbi:MAG TPA: methyltransferase [Bacteroidales bacterium]|nr:methyltransferase [Bacteroidales bacterium]HPF02801.1 methyltransferase [Bacteroidales bacterium]HPJ58883.1 methyltransferase [Bacteroidales bacterium]HPR12137.1 methyltransferase [Bacteroidales bacterium]HRW84821.1 methyltransferase [Bacteroidales bacterium]